MGAWFAVFLKENGYRVVISDNNTQAARAIARKRGFELAKDQETAITSSQVLVLATPTQTTKKILEQIQHVLSHETLLVEMSSVKEPLRGILQGLRKRGVPLLSIHPMFGPGAETLKGQTVLAISIPQRNNHANRILSLFRRKGARVIRCSLAEHDRMISALLTLPHFMNLTMTNTLRAMGFSPEQLRKLSGTTYRLQLLIAETITQENHENEASILMDSDHSVEIIRKYLGECEAAMNMQRKGNRRRLIKELHSSRNFLERDRMFSNAYEDFNAALAALAT